MNSSKALGFVKEQKSFVILVIVIIFAACTSSMFFTIDNLQNLFLQISIQGIISFGMTFTLIAGEFDMSVGSNLTLCGILFAQLLSYMSFGLAIIVVLLFAAVLGLINGILVAKLGVCSFIGTLGTMYAYKGLALMLSQGQPVPARTEEVLQVSNMQIGGFSIFPVIFIIVGLISAYVLTRTQFGRNIYAVGGNAEVANNSGISVVFYKTMSFVIVGVTAGLAGILLTMRLQSATPIAGDSLNLIVISSIIIGGTSPAGGVGSIPKSFIGLMIIGVLTNLLSLIGLSGYYQQVIQGAMTVAIIGATSFANYRKVSAI